MVDDGGEAPWMVNPPCGTPMLHFASGGETGPRTGGLSAPCTSSIAGLFDTSPQLARSTATAVRIAYFIAQPPFCSVLPALTRSIARAQPAAIWACSRSFSASSASARSPSRSSPTRSAAARHCSRDPSKLSPRARSESAAKFLAGMTGVNSSAAMTSSTGVCSSSSVTVSFGRGLLVRLLAKLVHARRDAVELHLHHRHVQPHLGQVDAEALDLLRARRPSGPACDTPCDDSEARESRQHLERVVARAKVGDVRHPSTPP